MLWTLTECTALLAVKGPADGLLVLSAAKVVIANATTLTLSGIANTTSWVKYPPSPRAGALAEVRDCSTGRPCVLPQPAPALLQAATPHYERPTLIMSCCPADIRCQPKHGGPIRQLGWQSPGIPDRHPGRQGTDAPAAA